MSALDPSYLRSIRDGILSGNIEANNNEALPDGLVGLYDKELFPPTMKWKERSELLHFFLVFALAQKEISADFTAEILGDEWYNQANEQTSKEEKRIQRVTELIQLCSKRFSSAGGGKYRLYHERFRVYILQKVSEEDIAQFNAKFIALCEKALEVKSEKDIPEKEIYALEYITTHFYISAMQGEKEGLNKEHAESLKKYAYDQQFWDRQIKASKVFDWSKRMLNEMMAWASKFNEDDEVIECSLNKVDLYHQEQNDAPRIVQLVADGDIETALERIEKFGDKDKEGLQRKFILYMLCLMELTLLDSKEKEHAKTSIEKILKHFDEHIPVNQPDLINWNDFFPSYLIFNLVSVLEDLGMNGFLIYTRTIDWDSEWIFHQGPYSKTQLLLLNACSSILNRYSNYDQHRHYRGNRNIDINIHSLNNFIKNKTKFDFIELETKLLSFYENYEKIKSNGGGDRNSNKLLNSEIDVFKKASELSKNDELEIANSLIEKIIFPYDKCRLFLVIANELIIKGDFINADKTIKKALILAENLPKTYLKSIAIIKIARMYNRYGKITKSNLLINDAIELALKIDKKWEKDRAFKKILNEISYINNWGFIKLKLCQQLKINQGISDEEGIDNAKNKALVSITTCLIDQHKIEQSKVIINLINNKNWRESAISKAVESLSNKGFYEDSIAFCGMINRKDSRIDELIRLSAIIYSNGNKQLGEDLISEAIETARTLIVEQFRLDSIKRIYSQLIKQEKKDSAQLLVKEFGIEIKNYIDYNTNQNEPFKIDLNNIESIENYGKEIDSKNDRINYWKDIGKALFMNIGFIKALKKSELFKSPEARLFINDSILCSLDADNINLKELMHSIKNHKLNIASIKYLLNMFALNQIFCNELSEENIQLYNRTLNLQWAIDIKNQLPN